MFDSSPKYYYIHRENSITTSQFKKNDFNVVEAYEKNLNLIEKSFPELKKQAQFRLLWSYTYVLDKMILSPNIDDKESYKKVISKLKHETINILLNPFFSVKRKVVTVILLFSPKIYGFMLKYQKRKNMKLHN